MTRSASSPTSSGPSGAISSSVFVGLASILLVGGIVGVASGCSVGQGPGFGGDGGVDGMGAGSDGRGAGTGDGTPGGDGDGDGDGRGSADGGLDGSARRDGSAADAAPPAPKPPEVPTKVGTITVGQTITYASGQTFYSSYATAMFHESPPPSGSTTSCSYDLIGGCHVYDCDLTGPQPGPVTLRYASAGTVSITGGATTYSMSVAAGGYTSVSSQQLLYGSGTVLTASSTGGEVPAFSGKSLTIPSTSFAVSTPTLATSTLSLSRSAALPLAWSGATGRTVYVNVSTTEDDIRSVSVACEFPGTPGTATIPAAAMSKLLATSAAVDGYFSMRAPIETKFTSGDWAVTFSVTHAGYSKSFVTGN